MKFRVYDLLGLNIIIQIHLILILMTYRSTEIVEIIRSNIEILLGFRLSS